MCSEQPDRRPGPRGALAAFCLLIAASCGERGAVADPGSIAGGSVASGGVRVSFTAESLEADAGERPLRRGDRLRLSFQVSDEVAGSGLTGLHLGAWLVARPQGAPPPDEEGVREMVRKLVGSNLNAGSYTNLNTYYFVTLNTDRTLALMNPFLDFSRTKMKSVLPLPSVGADLAMGPGDELIFVSLPEEGQVWVVDALTLKARDQLTAGVAPRQLAEQPGTGYVWVSDDGSEQAFVLDGITGKVVGAVDVGAGPKRFAFDADGRNAYVCAVDSGLVTAVETPGLAVRKLAEVGGGISGFTWSQAAGALFALAAGTGELVAVDPRSGERRAVPSVPAGSGPLYAPHDGRWLFAVDTQGNRVHVLDAATSAPPRAITTGALPSQIAFTEAFAHVYCEGSRFLTAIQLSALASGGSVPTIEIPIMQGDPKQPDPGRTGDFIVPTPEDNSVLICAPDEKIVYFYQEGMMAPMGSYQNYNRIPVAVAVVDRSLFDVGNGFYTISTAVEYFGKIDVFTYLGDPTQLFGHFEFDVEPDVQALEQREKDKPEAVPQPLQAAPILPVGTPTSFRFRLVAPDTQEPVTGQEDVRVMARARYGNWYLRVPAEALEDGSYKVDVTFPEVGKYLFQVESRGLNLRYTSHLPMEVSATDDVEGGAGTGKDKDNDGDDRR